MSLGYAEQLSYREEIGTVGAPELNDSEGEVVRKANELADMIASAKSVVAMTGAGISTSCGIPDFRGPNGVWTCQKQGRPLPKLSTTFTSARPGYTHMALLELAKAGKLRFVISQNVDGLHARSGLPPAQLAELHGNCFAERCPACNKIFVRDFEMLSVGFKPTGRTCSEPGCRGRLRDFILDWEDALPDDQLQESEDHAAAADVMLCLGTSLQIRPVCQIPLITKRAGGRIVIVNLQKTPKHRSAALVLHARCDDVMRRVMQRLKLPVRPFVRRDRLRVAVFRGPESAQDDGQVVCDVVVAFASVHGPKCPLPLVAKVRCRWPLQTLTSGTEDAESRGDAAEEWLEERGGARDGPMTFRATVPLNGGGGSASTEAAKGGGGTSEEGATGVADSNDARNGAWTSLQLQLELTDAADEAFRRVDAELRLQLGGMRPTAITRGGAAADDAYVCSGVLTFVSQVAVYEEADEVGACVEQVRQSAVQLEGAPRCVALCPAAGGKAPSAVATVERKPGCAAEMTTVPTGAAGATAAAGERGAVTGERVDGLAALSPALVASDRHAVKRESRDSECGAATKRAKT